ncbi:MAG: shikimate dehydrogenase [Caldilineales bacterium]|nr:shikimate dehydrogenase [Caldilineales bacterium]MDW8316420.1 shikimate dehydrogenase [Anaerolineae bacterium]
MTLLTGLLGYPLGHSVSPAMHNAAFRALGLDGRYESLPTPPEQLAETVAGLAAAGYRGVNVTIPHKQAVMPLLDALSEAAQAIGAVNTVVVQRPPEPATSAGQGPALPVLYGDNTDWIGFLHPLDALGFDPAGKSALLLGAGGSARAVVYALAQRGLAHLTLWARSSARAAELAGHAQSLFPALTVHCSPFTVQRPPDLIVNTTPVGMWPHVDASPWPHDLPFPQGALVYDLVYRPERTRFLQQAEAAGCATVGGLEMLVVQGAAAFERWTGVKPPLAVMLAAARAALAETP